MTFTVGSLFSGVGGLDMGLERAGMKIIWQCEIDPRCRQVLRRHWPNVEIREDVKAIKPRSRRAGLAVPRLLCGGFPCTDLSVAGRRAGLAGERSGLFWEFLRIARGLRPEWILLENVPGLLSSHKGRDMLAVVRGLEECGYGWAYRVLDARYFGVPQRRRRVFIVGCLGGARRAAAVLFESTRGEWDSAACGTPGQDVAVCLRSRSARGRGVNRPCPVAPSEPARQGKGGFTDPASDGLIVAAHARESVGRDAEEDGTGRGTPLTPVEPFAFEPRIGRCGRGQPSEISPAKSGTEAGDTSDMRPCVVLGIDLAQVTSGVNRTQPSAVAPPLCVAGQPVAFHATQDPISGEIAPAMGAGNTSDMRPCVVFGVGQNQRGEVRLTEETATALTGGGGKPGEGYPCVAFHATQDPISGEIAPAIGAGNKQGCGTIAVAFDESQSGVREGSVHATLDANKGSRRQEGVREGMQVRRLTPRECERLMGWPDDHTRWGVDEKGNMIEMSDSARYRMAGNGVVASVAEWIARRILAVEGE